MRIYVATSWRNERQPEVVQALRDLGHEVYDFRNPIPGNDGFRWLDVDPDWKNWTPEQFRACLQHPVAEQGFALDMNALEQCEACVLVMPCGRSAHLEAGWAKGAGRRLYVLLSDGEPELMLAMADRLCVSLDELLALLSPEQWDDPFDD